MNTSLIEKELVCCQQFSKSEVLSDRYAIAQRRSKLERAVLLGNVHKVKCKIFFETQEGAKAIETTIWAVTDNYIIIKGGTAIPIRCISGVE
jgi:predicted alternative tryptophan synthase beta-subunit